MTEPTVEYRTGGHLMALVRFLTVLLVLLRLLQVFFIDLWHDGLKDGLWNFGCNTSDWWHWVLTGHDRFPENA